MKKLIIGITGKNGSGKDSVADYLVSKFGAKKIVFSDMLKEALSIFVDSKEISRLDMAWLSTGLRDRYGQGILAKGVKRRILSTAESMVIISGVRDFGELEMIRSFPNSIFICVQADAEIRWKRMVSRQEKSDDEISFNDFLDREKLNSESMIEGLSAEADVLIVNNGQKSRLLEDIDEVLGKYMI